MKYSFFSRIRDVLFLCILLLLTKVALERVFSFVVLHKDSIIHELDRSFIDQIYTARRQLHFLEEHPLYANTHAVAIAQIKDALINIEEKYKKNSPGLALLGPIGSAAIVIKEEQLQQKLLETVNDLNRICATLHDSSQTFIPAQTINEGLENNKGLLRILLS